MIADALTMLIWDWRTDPLFYSLPAFVYLVLRLLIGPTPFYLLVLPLWITVENILITKWPWAGIIKPVRTALMADWISLVIYLIAIFKALRAGRFKPA